MSIDAVEGEGCGGSDVTVAKQHEEHLCDSVVGVG